jgi:hypothetical protein
MPAYVDTRREAARAFFDFLERELRADDVLADKQCVRLIIEKAQAEQAAQSRKRFDPEAAFRSKILYGKIDDAITAWCQKRDLRTDAYSVFRYEGPERGPAQHDSALGLSLPAINRVLERLAAATPEVQNFRTAVVKEPTKAISPAFRLQSPLPFGAVGEVKYGCTRKDLERGMYQTATYAATGGDPSRNWRYDCGLFIGYAAQRPRALLGDELCERWPEIQARVWDVARVWAILL